MRVTTGPRRGVVKVVAAAVLALSVALLVLATIEGAASPEDRTTTFRSRPDATTSQDPGLVNPWAAGDAAVLRALAELGRAGFDGCPWSDQREPCGSQTTDTPSTTTPAQGETTRPHETGAASGDAVGSRDG
jgi:hypothetical protein